MTQGSLFVQFLGILNCLMDHLRLANWVSYNILHLMDINMVKSRSIYFHLGLKSSRVDRQHKSRYTLQLSAHRTISRGLGCFTSGPLCGLYASVRHRCDFQSFQTFQQVTISSKWISFTHARAHTMLMRTNTDSQYESIFFFICELLLCAFSCLGSVFISKASSNEHS